MRARKDLGKFTGHVFEQTNVSVMSRPIFVPGEIGIITVCMKKIKIEHKPLPVGVMPVQRLQMFFPQARAPEKELIASQIEKIGIAKNFGNPIFGVLGNFRRSNRTFNHGNILLSDDARKQVARHSATFRFVARIGMLEPNVVHPGRGEHESCFVFRKFRSFCYDLRVFNDLHGVFQTMVNETRGKFRERFDRKPFHNL